MHGKETTDIDIFHIYQEAITESNTNSIFISIVVYIHACTFRGDYYAYFYLIIHPYYIAIQCITMYIYNVTYTHMHVRTCTHIYVYYISAHCTCIARKNTFKRLQ